MEWSLGAELWSVVMEWGGVKFLSDKNLITLGTVYSMEWCFGAKYWSGVESDFGVAKVEWNAGIIRIFATPKFDSAPLQYSTQ